MAGVLLTGFEPYVEGLPINPSWEIVAPLDGRAVAGAEVRALRLPVVYGRAARMLEEAALAQRPRAIVCFGMHRRGASVDLERRFRFAARESEAQALGEPPSRSTLLPLERIAAALGAEGYDARLSSDAGLYLCEHVGFMAVGLARRMGVPLAGFVHVPAPAALAVERQMRIPEVILETILAPPEA